MNVVFAIGSIAAVLFALAYFTRRRFGVLGLALAAGYVLSKVWEESIPGWASHVPLDVGVVDSVTLITLGVILLPSLVLLLGGPSYRTVRGRLMGSLFYALLATVFSLGALEHSLVLMGQGRVVFDTLIEYQQYILTLALGISVVDIVHGRSNTDAKPSKKH